MTKRLASSNTPSNALSKPNRRRVSTEKKAKKGEPPASGETLATEGGTRPSKAKKAGPVKRRREQQRAIDTKQTILNAALSEFAQMGFEAASLRNIAASTGLQHPLITYHYRTKEILWKAVAEYGFAQIRQLWGEGIPDQEKMAPIERLRAEYSAILRFAVAYPDFHHFMLRESRPGNPRLPWLVETTLLPTMQRLLPQIESAQDRGELPAGNPALIHYMIIGMTSVLPSLKDEIRQSAGVKTDSPEVVDHFMGMIDHLVFRSALPLGRHARRSADVSKAAKPAARKNRNRTAPSS